MDVTPSIKVTFFLMGDVFAPDDITKRMGITPTGIRLKDGFPPESLAAGFAKTIWSISIAEEHCKAVDYLFLKQMNILKGKEPVIRQICNDYNIKASFIVSIHMENANGPEIVLPREVIHFASSLDAEIGFDIYGYEADN